MLPRPRRQHLLRPRPAELLRARPSADDRRDASSAYHVARPRALRRGRVRRATARPSPSRRSPSSPGRTWPVTGLYFYDNAGRRHRRATSKPSPRGELEITDVNNALPPARHRPPVELGRGFAWLDTGTHDSLLRPRSFVQALEQRQGLQIACVEEIALTGWVSSTRRRSCIGWPRSSGKSPLRPITSCAPGDGAPANDAPSASSVTRAPMPSIFVTGGAGFIGSNYVRYVLGQQRRRGHRLDALTYAGNLVDAARRRRRPALPLRQGQHLRPGHARGRHGRARRRRALRGREPRRPLDRRPRRLRQHELLRHQHA